MSSIHDPDAAYRVRKAYVSCFGRNLEKIARVSGVPSSTAFNMLDRAGYSLPDSGGLSGYGLPKRYSTEDNAVTAAFRSVIGWCPFRDGAPEGTVFSYCGGRSRSAPTKVGGVRPRPYSVAVYKWP